MLERLPEVGPEALDVLEPDREPQQPGRDPVTLPAVARLELGLRPSEARGVLDRLHRALDTAPPPRRRRRRTTRGTRSRGSGRPRPQGARAGARRAPARSPPGAPAAPAGSARPRATSQAVSAGATIPARPAREVQAGRAAPESRPTVTPASTSSWPERIFVALWRAMSQPCSSGPDTQRRGHGRVADDDRGMRRGGIEVGHGQQRVGRRLEEDEICRCRRRRRSGRTRPRRCPIPPGGRTAAGDRSTHPRRARSSLRGAATSAPPSSPPPCPTDRGARARRRARRARPHRRRRSDDQRGRMRSDPAPRPRYGQVEERSSGAVIGRRYHPVDTDRTGLERSTPGRRASPDAPRSSASPAAARCRSSCSRTRAPRPSARTSGRRDTAGAPRIRATRGSSRGNR